MKVLVAMSGGVDSSVAAQLLTGQGHTCIGCTMKLYGNEDAGLSKGHREAAGRLDGVAHAGIDRIEHERDEKVEQRQLEGIDLAGAQKRARFGLDRAQIE